SVVLKSGTLSFSPNGALKSVDGTNAPFTPNFSIAVPVAPNAWKDGAAASAMNWSIADANGVANLTGYAAASQTSSLTQNGQAAGSVSDVSIDSTGQIVATIGAGQTVVLGQLALANFNNPGGLQK